MSWEVASTGLQGTLTATNRLNRPCDLTLLPEVHPLAVDGSVLDVPFDADRRGLRGPVTLRPGRRATAPVGWGGPWCGAEASGNVAVTWSDAKSVAVPVQGARQPACETKDGGNTWAAQFELDA